MTNEDEVRVRIAVAVDHTGDWNACGYKGCEDDQPFSNVIDTIEHGEYRYWVEATLKKPPAQPNVVEGTVTEATE